MIPTPFQELKSVFNPKAWPWGIVSERSRSFWEGKEFDSAYLHLEWTPSLWREYWKVLWLYGNEFYVLFGRGTWGGPVWGRAGLSRFRPTAQLIARQSAIWRNSTLEVSDSNLTATEVDIYFSSNFDQSIAWMSNVGPPLWYIITVHIVFWFFK